MGAAEGCIFREFVLNSHMLTYITLYLLVSVTDCFVSHNCLLDVRFNGVNCIDELYVH